MMAAVAIGAFPDMAAAVDDMGDAAACAARSSRMRAEARYDQLSRSMSKARQAMPPVWADLAARAREALMSKLKIAVIGDRFMRAAAFTEALAKVPGVDAMSAPWSCPGRTNRWATAMSMAASPGLKEYMGDPDEIVRFVDGAEILVTHLAPISASMLDRLPTLKLIAVSRGGPVNIDVAACKRAR